MTDDKAGRAAAAAAAATRRCRPNPVTTPIVSREREQARCKRRGVPEDRLVLPAGWWLWGWRSAQQRAGECKANVSGFWFVWEVGQQRRLREEDAIRRGEIIAVASMTVMIGSDKALVRSDLREGLWVWGVRRLIDVSPGRDGHVYAKIGHLLRSSRSRGTYYVLQQ